MIFFCLIWELILGATGLLTYRYTGEAFEVCIAMVLTCWTLKDADILKFALFVRRKSWNLINVTSMCPFLDTSGIPQKFFRSFEGNSSIARELTYKLRHVIVHWLNKLGIFQSFYRKTQLL